MTTQTYIGLGSNLGDRYGNIAQAIQGLRRLGRLSALSSLYETTPIGVAGPAFLNLVGLLEHDYSTPALSAALRDLERRLGRAQPVGTAARPIDLDILDVEAVIREQYYLVALAELAPTLITSAGPITNLAAAVDPQTVRRRDRTLRFRADRQSGVPDVPLAIDQVGVAKLQRTLQLEIDRRIQTVLGSFILTADLAHDRAGVHMSRFSEHLESITLEVLAEGLPSRRIEEFLVPLARAIVAAQTATSADVHFTAPFTIERWTPVSGQRGEECYVLHAHARAAAQGVRVLVGVEVEGMTACPCAQLMMREAGVRDLEAAGFGPAEARRAIDALPAATHNQRGRGTLTLGLPPDCRAAPTLEDLVEIVEQSMSSETYELLKRPDEFFVVHKAHRNPKFVEDVVRGMIIRTLDRFEELPDETFIEVSQVNDESIHKHDAIARAAGTFGEFRRELQGGAPAQRLRRYEWLAR